MHAKVSDDVGIYRQRFLFRTLTRVVILIVAGLAIKVRLEANPLAALHNPQTVATIKLHVQPHQVALGQGNAVKSQFPGAFREVARIFKFYPVICEFGAISIRLDAEIDVAPEGTGHSAA